MKLVMYVRCDEYNTPLWFFVIQGASNKDDNFSLNGTHGYTRKRDAIVGGFRLLYKMMSNNFHVTRIVEV